MPSIYGQSGRHTIAAVAVLALAFLGGFAASGPLTSEHPLLRAVTALGSAQLAAHAALRGPLTERAYVVFLSDDERAAALAALIEETPGVRRAAGWPWAGSWLVEVDREGDAAFEAVRRSPLVRLAVPRPALTFCH